jgi:hypothetical protein
MLHPSLAAVAILFASCSGVTFKDIDVVNSPLDTQMLGHSVFADTEIIKRHIDELPGYIFSVGSDGSLDQLATVVPEGYKIQIQAITESTPFYHSIIDNTAGAQGSYLKLVSAELKQTQRAEVTIAETAEARIDRESVPWTAIKNWALANPGNGPKRVYVQGVLLATITKTLYAETTSSATVDGGAAFGIGGKVYASSKSSATQCRAYVGAHLLDIDKIASGNAGAVGASMEEFVVSGFVIKKAKLLGK